MARFFSRNNILGSNVSLGDGQTRRILGMKRVVEKGWKDYIQVGVIHINYVPLAFLMSQVDIQDAKKEPVSNMEPRYCE